MLLGLLGAAATHGVAKMRQQAAPPPEPWLACGLEPYSELPLLDSPVGRALYPNGAPCLQDVHQGALGDCYLLAALLAVLHKWPWLITQRIRLTQTDADGTLHFKVGLQSHPTAEQPGRTDWICVSSKFPPRGARGALWVSLFEKAFAKHNDAYKVLGDPALPGYAALEVGGGGQGLEALTGRPAGYAYYANATGAFELLPFPELKAAHLASLFKRPAAAGFLIFGNWTQNLVSLPSGEAAQQQDFADGSQLTSWAGLHHMTFVDRDPITVYGQHAYAVLEVNAQGDFLLCNPHGVNPQQEDAKFWLPRRCVERMVIGHVVV